MRAEQFFKVPREVSSAGIAERSLLRRAVEAAVWGMPIVSVDAMRQAFFRDAKARYGDVVFWSKPADSKLQITTPNATAYYVYFNFNTKDGPIILDLPPAVSVGLFGSLLDAWQEPQADVGPSGRDDGKGGKYLLLPPGYKQGIPSGQFAIPFETYNGYSFLRIIPASSSEADTAKALELVKHIRIYALWQAASPPPQRHIDMTGKLFDGIVRFDDRFYDSLARMTNEEPVQTRDLVAMGQLTSLGIEKGKEFNPDPLTRKILKKAALEARADFIESALDAEQFWPGSRWGLHANTAQQSTPTFQTRNRLEIDARGLLFFMGCAPPKKRGIATFYVLGMKDASDDPLDGGNMYRLTVPPNVPAKQFWAVTAYDLETAAFIRDSASVEVNSYRDVQKNSDGSVDVFFGPAAPEGKESNWVYTEPGKPWFSAFRFYGPEPAVFEKTWVLPDIEKMN